MYLSYAEYVVMGGTLDEAAFNTYCFAACQKIKAATFGRITTVNDTIARCVVRVTDILQKADVCENKVSSFSHDGYSQSYSSVNAADCVSAIDDIIYDYLIGETAEDGTPLLYRGVE